MRIVITGVSGFVGSSLYTFLKDKRPDWELFGFSRKDPAHLRVDIREYPQVRWTLDELKPDVIVHLAANANGAPGKDKPQSIIEDNVYGTVNLLEYAPPGCHFINASTIVIYGNSSDNYRHHGFGNLYTINPTSMYATSKLNAEQWVNRYTEVDRVQGLNLRFCAIVGPYADMTHGYLKDLITKIKSKNSELNLIGKPPGPGSIKPYLNIFDACNSILFSIEQKLSGAYNICTKDNMSVEAIAELAMDHYGIQKEIVWDDKVWEGDISYLEAHPSKIIEQGFVFKYPNSKDAIQAALNVV